MHKTISKKTNEIKYEHVKKVKIQRNNKFNVMRKRARSHGEKNVKKKKKKKKTKCVE